ncbi:Uncharacterized protein OBRU01_26354, partial [Operophtera brumata]
MVKKFVGAVPRVVKAAMPRYILLIILF